VIPTGTPDDVTPAPSAEALGPLGIYAPAGILAGRAASGLDTFGLTPALAVPSVLAATLALVACMLLLHAGRERTAALAVLGAVVLVTIAGVLLRLDTHRAGLIPELVDRGGDVAMTGRVAAEPRLTANGWSTVLTLDTVGGVPTRERVVAVLDETLALGDRVTIVASARPLPDGGYGRWLAQAHAVAVLDVRALERTGSPGRMSRASEWTRERIRTAATRHQDRARGGCSSGSSRATRGSCRSATATPCRRQASAT
jgi:hypothetical protein